MLGQLLVDHQRKDELRRVERRLLELCDEPRLTLFLHRIDGVLRQRDLLVAHIGVVRPRLEHGLFLPGNHLAHQFHSRIVLAAIATAVGFDLHLSQVVVGCLQFDGDAVLSTWNRHREFIIAYTAHHNARHMAPLDGEAAVAVAHDVLVRLGNEHVGVRYAVTITGINDRTFYLRCDCQWQQNCGQYQK